MEDGNQNQVVPTSEPEKSNAANASPATPYKLPNGCSILPGGRVRIPKEHLNLIPAGDWEAFGLDIVEGDQSFGSEVIQRTATASEPH